MYSIKNVFSTNTLDVSVNTDEIIYKSQFSENFIALTKNSKRLISYAGTANFAYLVDSIDSIIKEIKKDGVIVEIKPDDLLNAHKTNSIMASFPLNISLISYFKTTESFFDTLKTPTTRSILITLDNSQSAINYLYFYEIT
jgi:hypothetical protein